MTRPTYVNDDTGRQHYQARYADTMGEVETVCGLRITVQRDSYRMTGARQPWCRTCADRWMPKQEGT